jgi:ATP/maltotriose-dependent transcriptional regulator MalT
VKLSAATDARTERNQIPQVQIFQDSLNLNVSHLPRDDLVERIYLALDIRTRFILFNSAAGSGKTSLLALFAHRYRQIHCIAVSFLDIDRFFFSELASISVHITLKN